MRILDWFGFTPKKIKLTAIVFCIALLTAFIGTLTPLSLEEAMQLRRELHAVHEHISIQLIFGNNFMICLLMFVPVAGPIVGGLALYNSGVAVAALSSSEGLCPQLAFLMLLLIPVTWLEFIAYSIGLSESVWLIWCIKKRRLKEELKIVCRCLTLCAVILLVAAAMEMLLNNIFLS